MSPSRAMSGSVSPVRSLGCQCMEESRNRVPSMEDGSSTSPIEPTPQDRRGVGEFPPSAGQKGLFHGQGSAWSYGHHLGAFSKNAAGFYPPHLGNLLLAMGGQLPTLVCPQTQPCWLEPIVAGAFTMMEGVGGVAACVVQRPACFRTPSVFWRGVRGRRLLPGRPAHHAPFCIDSPKLPIVCI